MTYIHTARCRKCEWTAEGDHADGAAAKHTKDTGHGTVTSMRREADW